MTFLEKCAVITPYYTAVHPLLVCVSIALWRKLATRNGQGTTIWW